MIDKNSTLGYLILKIPCSKLRGIFGRKDCGLFRIRSPLRGKRLAEVNAKRLEARIDLLLKAWVQAFSASKITLQ